MKNKLTKQQEKRFERLKGDLHCIQEGCSGDGVVPERGGDGEWQPAQCEFCYKIRFPFFEIVKQHIADEIARARVEGVRGFSDYIVSELIKMPFINVKITKNSVGMMRNKFLKNENIKRHL